MSKQGDAGMKWGAALGMLIGLALIAVMLFSLPRKAHAQQIENNGYDKQDGIPLNVPRIPGENIPVGVSATNVSPTIGVPAGLTSNQAGRNGVDIITAETNAAYVCPSSANAPATSRCQLTGQPFASDIVSATQAASGWIYLPANVPTPLLLDPISKSTIISLTFASKVSGTRIDNAFQAPRGQNLSSF